MTTVGFLYPGHAAEDDYPRIERMLGGSRNDIHLAVEHTYGEDLHAVDALLDLGNEQRLAEGARRLTHHEPAAVVWACTSGSFVFGPTGAAEQVEKLSAAAGVPASSTSFAFAHAAEALGLRTVAVAASYPDDVAVRFGTFLAAGGLTVVGLASSGIVTAAEVGQLPDDEVLALATAHDRDDADAVLVPDTAMRTAALVEPLESRLGKPVLTANQVTVWEGLRIAGLLGRLAPDPGLGALFRASAPETPEAVTPPSGS